ncbi:Type 1 glutamine amidotransferase-like domain-containing protein [Streptomyces sp. SudanB182_2057]|uniref:Type 1 glutamine amidotransferase-like domain-containing protein n=1 Tax=Streptomyces sp. SudanB182_2057 TaxID=3035281 RepID=UPI003F57111F
MGSPVFLIGGGWDRAEVYEPFLRRARGARRIGCLIVDEGDGAAQFARYAEALGKAGPACVPVPLLIPLGGRFAPESALDGIDGLLVCGGLTPAYQEALAECLERLPGLLAERGLPYAGFSAGAAVAARRAVVGGWLVDGAPVCPEETGEDLAEVEVRAGLGLVPFAVDVHAAQWGTLARLVAAVGRRQAPYGVAVDENTLLGVHDGEARVSGAGRVHVVRPAPDGSVTVRPYSPGESFALQ